MVELLLQSRYSVDGFVNSTKIESQIRAMEKAAMSA
jgi:hypothetical protein